MNCISAAVTGSWTEGTVYGSEERLHRAAGHGDLLAVSYAVFAGIPF